MLLFRKKTTVDKPPEAKNAVDSTARAIASAIINRQIQLAKCCSSCYERLSARAKMVGLLLFCLLFGGTSFWFLAKGVWPNQKKPLTGVVQSNQPGSHPLTEPNHRDNIHFRNNHPLKKIERP